MTTSTVQQGLSSSLKNTSKTKQGVQQIIMPAGQKVLLSPSLSNMMTQKLLTQQTQSPSTTTTTLNQQKNQQVTTQQYVNTSNVQQQILVSGQRIILGPGQTIVTQRAVQSPISSATSAVSTESPSISTMTRTDVLNDSAMIDDNQLQGPIKTAKPIAILQQQNVEKTSQATATGTGINSQQQIVVQNSNLAQQLAQGKLQVATVNGQQVIIKQLGNCQAQIVAHIKLQSDGNSHIVTTPNNAETQSQPKATKAASAFVLQVSICKAI